MSPLLSHLSLFGLLALVAVGLLFLLRRSPGGSR
jgi:MYXO-CTERM domain-containing protein